MLTILAKLLKALNSEAAPWQIGWALALGVLAGLLPFGLLTLVVLFIACFITINLSTFIVAWGLSGTLMLVVGNSLEQATWKYAQNPDFLELLSDSETLQVLHLHHSLVLGALLLGLSLMIPVAWLGARSVRLYRTRVMGYIQKFKIVHIIKASKFAHIYNKLT